MEKLIITPDTKIYELLNNYPELEDKLIETAPQFKKLKNPVLRKTVARVTSIKQAAVIGGVGLSELINLLRKEVGQDEFLVKEASEGAGKEKPEWLNESRIKIEYNASIDLEQGIHPINKLTKEMETLKEGEIYLLKTAFVPAPLIKLMEQKGYETYVQSISQKEFHTFIKK